MKTILEEVLDTYPFVTKEELLEDCCAGAFGYGFPEDCPEDCRKCWNRKVNKYEDKTGNPE